MKEYQHGTRGEILQSIEKDPESRASYAYAYVGTAPINLVRGYEEKNLINEPLRLSSVKDVEAFMGRSSDYASFTLCEAFEEHFNNPLGGVGPIYVINVLDPKRHAGERVTKSLTFANGRVEFKSDVIVLDTLALADKVEGTDYQVQYNFRKSIVSIEMLKKEDYGITVEASYDTVNPALVTPATVIGAENKSEGTFTGIYALELLYQKYDAVLAALAAPGWSEDPGVYDAMCEIVQNLNGHWNAMVYADIPIQYEVLGGEGTKTTVAVDTIEKAKNWKAENNYTHEFSKVFWPQKSASGVPMHLSTAAMATKLRVDTENGGIPFESPSNKAINADKQYFGASATNKGFDDTTAGELNAVGITTLCYSAGRWVLWGPHTAQYNYSRYMDGDIDARAVFDVNLQMLEYITNQFQIDHGTEIDSPLSPSDRDTILIAERGKLENLKSLGALIGEPKVLFNESSNSLTDMKNGDFAWDFEVTNTPPLKSATARIAYTDEGFSAYFTNGES